MVAISGHMPEFKVCHKYLACHLCVDQRAHLDFCNPNMMFSSRLVQPIARKSILIVYLTILSEDEAIVGVRLHVLLPSYYLSASAMAGQWLI